MCAFGWLIDTVLSLLLWAIIIHAIASWLIAFNVVNRHNQFVSTVLYTLDRALNPLYQPVRRVLPDLGGIDFSPLIVGLLVMFVRLFLAQNVFDQCQGMM
jgi:YggT family protein